MFSFQIASFCFLFVSTVFDSPEVDFALGEFSKSLYPAAGGSGQCLKYKVVCRTPFQELSIDYIEKGSDLYVSGEAYYIDDSSAARARPHSFCGAFSVLVVGKKVVTHHIDKCILVESEDLVLPREIQYSPRDWMASRELGDLFLFAKKVSDSTAYQIESSASPKSMQIKSVFKAHPEEGFISMEFDPSAHFCLSSLQFLPKGNAKASSYESAIEWQDFMGYLVPKSRSDWSWGSSSGSRPHKPNRQAEYSNFRFGPPEEFPKVMKESDLPIGTMVVRVLKGTAKRSFVGGDFGEKEFSMISHAFRLRQEFGLFTREK